MKTRAALIIIFNILSTVVMSQTRNMNFEVTSSNNSTMEVSSSSVGSFRPEEFLVGVLKKFLEPVPAEFKGKQVIYIIEAFTADRRIHQQAFKRTAPGATWWKFNLIPDPTSNMDASFRIDWNGDLVRSLSQLPAGKHLIDVKTYLELGDKRVHIGWGEINFDNSQKTNIDLKKRGDDIDKKSSFDPAKEMDDWVKKNGGWETFKKEADAEIVKREKAAEEAEARDYYQVIAKNDCLQSITVVVNGQQTYIIDGKGSGKIKVFRGREGELKVDGRTIMTITEAIDKSTITVCPK
jgi:hypothetical protein